MDYDFTTWLSREINRNDWTNSRLAELVGVTPSSIGDWLRGISQPKPDKLMRLADLTGKDPYVLFNWVYNLPLPSEADRDRLTDALGELRPKEKEIMSILQGVTPEGLEIFFEFAAGLIRHRYATKGNDGTTKSNPHATPIGERT